MILPSRSLVEAHESREYGFDMWHTIANTYLRHLGYNGEYTSCQYRRGKYGVLSNRKRNWGDQKLFLYFVRKYPDDYAAWRAAIRLTYGLDIGEPKP